MRGVSAAAGGVAGCIVGDPSAEYMLAARYCVWRGGGEASCDCLVQLSCCCLQKAQEVLLGYSTGYGGTVQYVRCSKIIKCKIVNGSIRLTRHAPSECPSSHQSAYFLFAQFGTDPDERR